jgi:hypothetical protein
MVDEFACATLKPLETYNPFDPAYRVGTSSAGSAAAVCDYQCHVALGTQTVLTIRSNELDTDVDSLPQSPDHPATRCIRFQAYVGLTSPVLILI